MGDWLEGTEKTQTSLAQKVPGGMSESFLYVYSGKVDLCLQKGSQDQGQEGLRKPSMALEL